MRKSITVRVEVKRNWRGDKYAEYSTNEHGIIAELDYPSVEREETRVYPIIHNEKIGDITNYITFSALPQGIIGAETATKGFLLDNGFFVKKFDYPAELVEQRKKAFKTK